MLMSGVEHELESATYRKPSSKPELCVLKDTESKTHLPV